MKLRSQSLAEAVPANMSSIPLDPIEAPSSVPPSPEILQDEFPHVSRKFVWKRYVKPMPSQIDLDLSEGELSLIISSCSWTTS